MIKQDIFYYGIAKLITISISLFTVKILSSNLSVDTYGKLELYFISISLVTIIVGFSINSAINREMNLFNHNISDVLTSSFLFLLKTIILLIIIYFINFIFHLLNDTNILILILITVFLLTAYEIFIGTIRALSKSKLYMYTSIFQAFSYFGLLYIQINSLNIVTILWAYMLSYFFILIYLIYYFRKYLIGKFNLKIYRSLAAYGVPLIFANLAGFIFNVSDKYMLGLFRNLYEVGTYSIAYKVASLIMIIIGVVQMAWPKYMYTIYKIDKDYQNTYDFIARYYLLLLMIVGIIVIFFSKFFILLFSNEDYLAGIPIIPIVSFGMILLGFQNISNQGIHISGKSHIMTIIIVIGGILNLGLNYLYIPIHGYMAAAWTTLISMLIMQILTLFFSINLLRVRYSYVRLLLSYITFTILTLSFSKSGIYIKLFVLVMTSGLLMSILYKKGDLQFIKQKVLKQ